MQFSICEKLQAQTMPACRRRHYWIIIIIVDINGIHTLFYENIDVVGV